MNDKVDIYLLLVILVGGLIGASVLIYMSGPLTIVHMETTELIVTQMEFTASSDSDVIILHFVNSGTLQVTVDAVKINNEKIPKDSIHGLTSAPGESGTMIIEYDWTTGNNYTVNLFTSDGTLAGYYTDTA